MSRLRTLGDVSGSWTALKQSGSWTAAEQLARGEPRWVCVRRCRPKRSLIRLGSELGRKPSSPLAPSAQGRLAF